MRDKLHAYHFLPPWKVLESETWSVHAGMKLAGNWFCLLHGPTVLLLMDCRVWNRVCLNQLASRCSSPAQNSVVIKLQTLVYDILPLEEGAEKRCSECALLYATCYVRVTACCWYIKYSFKEYAYRICVYVCMIYTHTHMNANSV